MILRVVIQACQRAEAGDTFLQEDRLVPDMNVRDPVWIPP
jgi:hypothetical protein